MIHLCTTISDVKIYVTTNEWILRPRTVPPEFPPYGRHACSLNISSSQTVSRPYESVLDEKRTKQVLRIHSPTHMLQTKGAGTDQKACWEHANSRKEHQTKGDYMLKTISACRGVSSCLIRGRNMTITDRRLLEQQFVAERTVLSIFGYRHFPNLGNTEPEALLRSFLSRSEAFYCSYPLTFSKRLIQILFSL